LSEIQSLARGLTILNLLSSEDTIGVTEVSDFLGVDKSSASRLLQTLARYSYVEQDAETRRYRLGSQIVALSRSVLTRMPLRDQAKPHMRQLVERTGECAHLAILANGQALYIDQEESPNTLRVNNDVGTLAPLHCTALGKVLLAFSNTTIADALKPFTDHTITDPVALRTHLDETRRRGYAVDDEEHNVQVRCLAAPVFDFRGKIVGAIGISGPAARLPRESLPERAAIVVEIARALSNRLSFRKADPA
jgi:DNA-binding IclR family transcriptional regulator